MAKNKDVKTNAMRILDSMKIHYETQTYECKDFVDGVQIADILGLPHEIVYKTLVAQGASRQYFVFVINAVTGYIRGGCTAIGMKKQYVTRIADTAQLLDAMIVSGGKLGVQLRLAPEDLRAACNGEFDDITRE